LKAWRTRRKRNEGIIPFSADKVIIAKTKRLPVMRKYSKKVRHLAALKAWKTRRENLETIHGTCLEDGCDEAVDCEKGEYRCKTHAKNSPPMCKKKKQHLAALKAWRTRRKNKTRPTPIRVFVDGASVHFKKKSSKVRHLAAIKAWKTRKRNSEVEHEIEMDDADNIV